MNKLEINQQLLQLESREIVKRWFNTIHGRELNDLRIKEINAAAKQSREFFRNAEIASYTVRPLLTFYGISTLSKALILLLKHNCGENSLPSGHGLTTESWNNVLYGNEMSKRLQDIGKLKVKTCRGLFTELISSTCNRISIHVSSECVDWHLSYNIFDKEYCFTLDELISRLPDLHEELKNIGVAEKYYSVSSMSFTKESGWHCTINAKSELVQTIFERLGYNVKILNNNYELSCDYDFFANNLPQFLHKYVNKQFGAIPSLYIVESFDNKPCFSELSLAFLLSYYLGMLVRYYPTHWCALVQGEKGDIYWTVLNRAQNYVENVYPELVIEFLNDILKEKQCK